MITGSKNALAFYTRIQDFRTTLAHADDDMQKGWGSIYLQNMKNSLIIPPSALSTDIRMVSKKRKSVGEPKESEFENRRSSRKFFKSACKNMGYACNLSNLGCQEEVARLIRIDEADDENDRCVVSETESKVIENEEEDDVYDDESFCMLIFDDNVLTLIISLLKTTPSLYPSTRLVMRINFLVKNIGTTARLT